MTCVLLGHGGDAAVVSIAYTRGGVSDAATETAEAAPEVKPEA